MFVLPSRHDGWGVVINQALAAGLPIITSDAVGAGLDLVENGVNGMCVAANDLEGLYRLMETLALNPEIARKWGRRSRESARDLTPEAGAEKWVRVFESLPTRGHPAATQGNLSDESSPGEQRLWLARRRRDFSRLSWEGTEQIAAMKFGVDSQSSANGRTR